MPRYVLHPFWTKLIFVFGALAVVQWIIIVPLAIHYDLMTSLACWIGDQRPYAGVCPGEFSEDIRTAPLKVVPFMNDFFFMEWNLLPIFLALSHFFLSRFYETHQDEIRGRFRDGDGTGLSVVEAPIRDNIPLVATLLLVLCAIAVTAQFSKEAMFHLGRAFYWWDISISPAIFYVRLFFLMTNITLIALVLWAAFWGLQTLKGVVRNYKIAPRILDPLHCFGMQAYGDFLLLLVTPWFLAIVTAILEFNDNQGRQGWANNLGTALMGAVSLYGIFLIGAPLFGVRKQLEVCKRELIAELGLEMRTLEDYLCHVARGNGALDGGVNARATPAYVVYRYVSVSSSWPLQRVFGAPTLISLVSPFFGVLGISATWLVNALLHSL